MLSLDVEMSPDLADMFEDGQVGWVHGRDIVPAISGEATNTYHVIPT